MLKLIILFCLNKCEWSVIGPKTGEIENQEDGCAEREGLIYARQVAAKGCGHRHPVHLTLKIREPQEIP